MKPTHRYLQRLLLVCIAALCFGSQAQAQKVYYEFKKGIKTISFLASPNDADTVMFVRSTNWHEVFEYTRYNKEWIKATQNRYGRTQVGYARIENFDPFFKLRPKGRQEFRGFEVVADSVIIYPDDDQHFKGVAHKGEVLPFNREFADRYAYSVQMMREDYSFDPVYLEVRDKKALKATDKEPNVDIMSELAKKNLDYVDPETESFLFWFHALNLLMLAAEFFFIRWICIKVRLKMLKNTKLSNIKLFWIFLISVTYLMFKMSQDVYTALHGWYCFFGVLACIVYWLRTCVRNKDILNMRCDKCRIYPDRTVVDTITEGTETVYHTDTHSNDYVDHENSHERVEVSKYRTDHITDVHKRYTYRCRCLNCGHTWEYSMRGERISRHIDGKEKTTTKTTTYE